MDLDLVLVHQVCTATCGRGGGYSSGRDPDYLFPRRGLVSIEIAVGVGLGPTSKFCFSACAVSAGKTSLPSCNSLFNGMVASHATWMPNGFLFDHISELLMPIMGIAIVD